MGVAIEHYTYEDYKKWEGKWELIDGVAYTMAPSPLIPHQKIAYEIARALGNAIKEKGCKECIVLGEIDYKIHEDTTLKPDVVLTCNETNESYLTKAPQIIVEVVSSSSAKRDELLKFHIYESEGVLYYILVYPQDRRAKLYKLKDGRYIKEGDFSKESYFFDQSRCPVAIDFNEIFFA